jgi:hypothetical protein
MFITWMANLSSVEKSKAVVLGEGSYENGAFRTKLLFYEQGKAIFNCLTALTLHFQNLMDYIPAFILMATKKKKATTKMEAKKCLAENGIAFKEKWI